MIEQLPAWLTRLSAGDSLPPEATWPEGDGRPDRPDRPRLRAFLAGLCLGLGAAYLTYHLGPLLLNR